MDELSLGKSVFDSKKKVKWPGYFEIVMRYKARKISKEKKEEVNVAEQMENEEEDEEVEMHQQKMYLEKREKKLSPGKGIGTASMLNEQHVKMDELDLFFKEPASIPDVIEVR
ncbi:hypothetical protein AX774_g2081 [Zancudomyces culisetae]|uniref:Uncharacterized protein n=1 Tax=Zancudomyces culisetae TaxID=1213189 RepID=A0A1R1PTY2_ZANCU|nr:hypothetical protein AX774_g2081 [Zancudomyces culisetae]|eukprot:OMH84407.1 hypothetical protein AX774_g2081 [Zancudomyces culisetae]